MQLSVIILNYNVRHFLHQCIDSVSKALIGINAEIIVVDNNSPDDSCQIVKQFFPNVILVENKENAGFPKGNNIGVSIAKGEQICILNPDTVVAEDTFSKILSFVANRENMGIVGAKLVDGRGNFLPESKRGTPTPFVAVTKIAGLYSVFPNLKLLNQYYAGHLNHNQTGKVDILVGAFMVMKRDLYLEVGGFDEDCFMYSDDIDLSYTVLKAGKENFYYPETTVIHYKGESTVKDESYIRRFSEAMNFFYRKHFRPSPFFNAMMKIGAYVFAVAKSKKKVKTRDVSNYLLLSEDANLKNRLEKHLKLKVEIISIDQIHHKILLGLNPEIIFDTRSIRYGDIIKIMSDYGKLNVTFKNLHTDAGFLIGSNSSDDRGQVIQI
ncbi:MAG: glycosyltransferase family 2 protein [Flavobacterium sp.]|nr:glycosyltransferase family 2 protein [Flavobacterium sp.]